MTPIKNRSSLGGSVCIRIPSMNKICKEDDYNDKHKKQGVEDQKLIVIHVDSRGKGEQTDLFFYYHPDDKQGKALANKMHNCMEKNYKKVNKKRGYKGSVTARDLHMLRETKVPSAYIELGNIKHPTDQKRLFLAANRQLIADWLYEGMK